MNFTFLKSTGDVAFYRSDAEQAIWTQEEFSLNCTFPLDTKKIIERGMVILFQDPATNDWQAYEIRNCSMFPGDAYQQFTAEDIAISELTDCHINAMDEYRTATAQSVLEEILQGTGWNVGTVESNPSSMGRLDRGSVWQNVSVISGNWNVYVMPRVTVNSNGISGRFLDLLPVSGTDRGLRLAINKNVTDPCVTYDDSELYTALYGYGGTKKEGSGSSKITVEYDFSSVTWAKTSDHPAKPAGQTYLEYPEMTALYGRNGKPRFGYYQNTDIKDPAILLEKTWESLKQCCEPKISITGSVMDLKRLGYADVPMRLHDMAIIELEPVGLLFYKQIIQLQVDLLDPTKNTPTIGDYIPNIIYINRDTEKSATGGGKGRGRGGNTKVDLTFSEYETSIQDNGREIDLNARKINEHGDILNQAGMHLDPVTGVLIYAEDNVNMVGSKLHVQSDRITAEVTNRQNADNQLSSRITQTANQISLEVSERKTADASLSGRITVEANRITQEITDRTNADSTLSGRITVEAGKITQIVSAVGADGQVTAASICLAINNGGSTATINAGKIYLLGQTIADTITAEYIATKIASISNLLTKAIAFNGGISGTGDVRASGTVAGADVYIGSQSLKDAIVSASVSGNTLTLTDVNGNTVTFNRATALNGDWSGGTYTVTASPQGNRISTSVASDPSNARRDGNIIYIPLIDGSNESIGREAMCNFTNVLTAHSNCVAGLTRYGQQVITLYAKVDGQYYSVGQHYWYYKDSNSSLTTYYS